MNNITKTLATEERNLLPTPSLSVDAPTFIPYPPPFYPQADWDIYITHLYFSQIEERVEKDD